MEPEAQSSPMLIKMEPYIKIEPEFMSPPDDIEMNYSTESLAKAEKDILRWHQEYKNEIKEEESPQHNIPVKQLTCKECQKSFSSLGNITDKGEKSFICNACQKAFPHSEPIIHALAGSSSTQEHLGDMGGGLSPVNTVMGEGSQLDTKQPLPTQQLHQMELVKQTNLSEKTLKRLSQVKKERQKRVVKPVYHYGMVLKASRKIKVRGRKPGALRDKH